MLSTDLASMKKEIEKVEGKDGFRRFLLWLGEAHTHYEESVKHVLKKNFPTLLSMLRPSFLRRVLALHPFESIYSRASGYFWTDRLRRVFTFGSMYMGMSPFDAPGTYSLLQYTELAEGIWYPKGGFHTVIQALDRIGRRCGVRYYYSSPVARILISHDKIATGIVLSSGEMFAADVVVVNADLVYSYNHLLPPSSTAKSLKSRKASCSSISFYWAMDKMFTELEGHNIFLADDYRESFDDIFKQHQVPNQPSFYVNVPSRLDETASPGFTDALVVLVPIGHLLDTSEGKGLDVQSEQAMQRIVDDTREKVIKTIESRTGARNLKRSIAKEIVNTPHTWKERFNLDKGAILGLSHSFFNVLSFRPKTKHSNYENLYFVGASTHPGTGVPICLAGSKLVAEQILKNSDMERPWTRYASKDKEKRELDKMHVLPLLSRIHVALLAIMMVAISFYYRSYLY